MVCVTSVAMATYCDIATTTSGDHGNFVHGNNASLECDKIITLSKPLFESYTLKSDFSGFYVCLLIKLTKGSL